MIETQRLIIRPLSFDELTMHLKSPDKLAEEMGLIPSKSLIDSEAKDAIIHDLLPKLADSNKDSLFYTMWIIIGKSEKAIIGGICFHGEPDENGEVEIGYGIDEDYRNKGYMTETIDGLIHWLQNNKKARAVIAETDYSNRSSIRVLEKNDFRLLRQTDHSVMMKRLIIQ